MMGINSVLVNAADNMIADGSGLSIKANDGSASHIGHVDTKNYPSMETRDGLQPEYNLRLSDVKF